MSTPHHDVRYKQLERRVRRQARLAHALRSGWLLILSLVL